MKNIDKIVKIFPQAVTEAADANGNIIKTVDFELLKQLIYPCMVNHNEQYSFSWVGKNASLREAYVPTDKKMTPLIHKSKNWNNTGNMYIEGDNLDALKLLQETHHEAVDVIYIDPPYNTGRTFIFSDNYAGVHSFWCSMMLPRLMLARELLTQNGVIFISVDDNELDNLKKICDEVFGETCFISRFIWIKTATPPSLSTKIRKNAEYVLCYEKVNTPKKFYGNPLDNGDAPLLNTSNPIRPLTFPPGVIHFYFKPNSGLIPAGAYPKLYLHNNILVKNGVNSTEARLSGSFKWKQETLYEEIQKGTYFIIRTEKMSIRFQRKDNKRFKPPSALLDKNSGVATNEAAVRELAALGMADMFDFPKPVSLIKKLIYMTTYNHKNALILDFFAGSSTTAHAVMALNAEDCGSRRFILVQEPVRCAENSPQAKAGYSDICEIGIQRMLRSGDAIEKTSSTPQDTGFRTFKLELF